MEKFIAVTGPRGAGKEIILNKILRLDVIKSRGFNRIIPFTTRASRKSEVDGREYYFMSPNEVQKFSNGEILYKVKIGEGNKAYYSGTLAEEFYRHQNGIIDVTVEGGKVLSSYSKSSLLLYVYASEEERIGRVMERQNLTITEAANLISNEPCPSTWQVLKKLYGDFHLIHNPNGYNPDYEIEGIICEFLKASVA
ncbi:MAG TPA: hypothetical protein VFQ59_02600 [Candidatus Paceibacterota bacterium]|nr:hypothetical protein [Candidatus Paceibacterota bacterium]